MYNPRLINHDNGKSPLNEGFLWTIHQPSDVPSPSTKKSTADPVLLRRGSARRWRRPPSEERSCSARARASDQDTQWRPSQGQERRPKGAISAAHEFCRSFSASPQTSTLQLWAIADCYELIVYLWIYLYIYIHTYIYIYKYMYRSMQG